MKEEIKKISAISKENFLMGNIITMLVSGSRETYRLFRLNLLSLSICVKHERVSLQCVNMEVECHWTNVFLKCLGCAEFQCSVPLYLYKKEERLQADGGKMLNHVANLRQGVKAVQLVCLATMRVMHGASWHSHERGH